MQNISLTVGLIKGSEYLLFYLPVNEYICCCFRSGINPLQPQDVRDIVWPVSTIKWNIHILQVSPNTARRSGYGDA